MLRSLAPALALALAAPVASADSTRTATVRTENGSRLLFAPARANGPERLLVLLPGARKPASEYESLARRIQAASPLRLWIAIPKFAFDTPNPVELDGRMSSLFSEMRGLGFAASPATTFLGGHSLGGIMAQGYAKKNEYAGLVLLASYLTRAPGGESGLLTYGLPVLTLGGELDGQTRISRLALDAEASHALTERYGEEAVAARMPVVILEKVNHSQFAGPEQMASDLAPEIDYDTAQNRIAQVVSDFLTLNIPDSPENPEALSRLVLAMDATTPLVKGFTSLKKSDGTWCATAQAKVFGRSDIAIEEREVSDTFAFASSKPAISTEGPLKVMVTSRRKFTSNPMDISKNPESARETACKLKSREALEKNLSIPRSGLRTSCAELNRLAHDTALATLTDASRQRFLSKGRLMRFADDNELGAGVLWLPASLELDERESANGRFLEVRSPALFTALDAPANFAGMHYCKLISPAQALEWMLVDGLRP